MFAVQAYLPLLVYKGMAAERKGLSALQAGDFNEERGKARRGGLKSASVRNKCRDLYIEYKKSICGWEVISLLCLAPILTFVGDKSFNLCQRQFRIK